MGLIFSTLDLTLYSEGVSEQETPSFRKCSSKTLVIPTAEMRLFGVHLLKSQRMDSKQPLPLYAKSVLVHSQSYPGFVTAPADKKSSTKRLPKARPTSRPTGDIPFDTRRRKKHGDSICICAHILVQSPLYLVRHRLHLELDRHSISS